MARSSLTRCCRGLASDASAALDRNSATLPSSVKDEKARVLKSSYDRCRLRLVCFLVCIFLLIVCGILRYFILRRVFNFDKYLRRNVLLGGDAKYERCPSTRIGMLDYLIEKLREENISYAITYGTLLGALREKSIIPWTADVDLAIPDLKSSKVQSVFSSLECFYGDVGPGVFHFWSKAPNMQFVNYGFMGIQSHTVYVDVYSMPLSDDGKEVRVVGMSGKNEIPSYIIYPLNEKGAMIEGKWYTTPRRPEVFIEAVYGKHWKVPDSKQQEGMETEFPKDTDYSKYKD
jgi:hypothetical protein|eukprot:g7092.t1